MQFQSCFNLVNIYGCPNESYFALMFAYSVYCNIKVIENCSIIFLDLVKI